MVTAAPLPTCRITLFIESATYSIWVVEKYAIPTGALKRAAVPTPSAKPASPQEPTTNDVDRGAPVVAKYLRMTLLPVSATKSCELGASYATARGRVKAALVPDPSTQPLWPPTRVVTVALGSAIFRTALLAASATNRLVGDVVSSRHRPEGEENSAVAPEVAPLV